MLKKLLIIIALLLTQILVSYSVLDTLDCRYQSRNLVNVPDANILFYGHDNLSSNVALKNGLSTSDRNNSYDHIMSCHSNLSSSLRFYSVEINFTSTNFSDYSSLCGDNEPVMFITDNVNARVSTDPINRTNVASETILCALFDRRFSSIDVRWHVRGVDIDYSRVGYTCMFRTNSKINGHVSTCDSHYNLSLWARLFESNNFLVCNPDCTSKLDGRVYSACGTKISECKRVPTNCDGAIYGSWVGIHGNSTHEQGCFAPWTNTRKAIFTNDAVEVKSDNPNCEIILKKEFTVLVDNEQVSMNIYICQRGSS